MSFLKKHDRSFIYDLMGKGETTRAAILDEAIDLVSVKGLEALSIGDLAGRLGMSKSGLFAHFGSKEKLQFQVLETTAERFVGTVLRPALAHPRGEPRLRALVDRWCAWDDDPVRPGGCPLLAATFELDDRPGPLRDYLAGMQHRLLQSIARIASGAVQEGHFRTGLDVDQFSFEFNALMYGYGFSSRLLADGKARARLDAGVGRLIADAKS